jgi:hypothetical protein
MKNTIFILLSVFSIIIILTGCKKDSMDLFTDHSKSLPTVKTVSLAGNGDTILLTGKVTSTGTYPLYFTGFCFSKNPVPDLAENQILLGNNTVFQAYIMNLTPTDTYYFMAFAANNYGFAKGNIISYVVPKPGPVVPPCSLANNKISDNDFTYSVFSANSSAGGGIIGNFEIYANCSSSGGNDYSFDFENAPYSGIYTTAGIDDIESNNPYNKNVYVEVNTGMGGTFIAQPGSLIYITNSNGKFTVSFCDFIYDIDGTDVHVKGNLHTN